jgi:hypothetical protein
LNVEKDHLYSFFQHGSALLGRSVGGSEKIDHSPSIELTIL